MTMCALLASAPSPLPSCGSCAAHRSSGTPLFFASSSLSDMWRLRCLCEPRPPRAALPFCSLSLTTLPSPLLLLLGTPRRGANQLPPRAQPSPCHVDGAQSGRTAFCGCFLLCACPSPPPAVSLTGSPHLPHRLGVSVCAGGPGRPSTHFHFPPFSVSFSSRLLSRRFDSLDFRCALACDAAVDNVDASKPPRPTVPSPAAQRNRSRGRPEGVCACLRGGPLRAS